MAEYNSDPFGALQISKDMMSAQQRFLPTGQFFERMREAARIISAAQMEFGQALMRANSLLFGAFVKSSSADQGELSPSVAAKLPDPAA